MEDGREITYNNFLHVLNLIQKTPLVGELIGITPPAAQDVVGGSDSWEIDFFEGYDGSVFASNEYVCVVSEELSGLVKDGVLHVDLLSRATVHASTVEAELKVIGKVAGDESANAIALAPFRTVTELAAGSDGMPPLTELLQATIADNRELDAFKENAMRVYKDVGVFFNEQTFSMIIYDSEFYDITEALQQTIFFIDIATPFVYIISISIGFVASYLLIRRRKAEFAMMRSIGVNRKSIFAGALFEQTVLCATGVAAGCALFTLTWDYIFIRQPLIFFACYVLGATISAANAAGTDVLKLLRDKE